jgi:transcriptional regulator with PAS, ATPase and Fis domain
MGFTWPGNVRQLENVIKQIVVRGGETIVQDLLTQSTTTPSFSESGDLRSAENQEEMANTYSLKKRIGMVVANHEKKLIKEVLNKTNWNRRKAAELLEISYRSLLYKIKEYNLNTTQ